MAERASAVKTVYHVVDGAVSMYLVDAKHALSLKDEWKDRPWKEAEVEAFRRRKARQAKDSAADVPADDPPLLPARTIVVDDDDEDPADE